MLITSSNIFSPKYDPAKVDILCRQMSQINLRMTPIKRRWAQSVMHYNQTSKQAFVHRFVKLPMKSGRRTADGDMGEDYRTAEELKGPYTTLA